LGVLLPCRNEAAVLERRLRNLLADGFPAGALHTVLVIDDHSSDGTAELARELARRLPRPANVSLELFENPGPAGKAQALRAGLERLSAVDLWVLSDADVVQRPGSLLALVAAFEASPRLGLCCAAQEFVRDLAPDGRCLGAAGAEPVPASERYDRWTAAVRRFESRCGKLFSVHGQLLAWRRATGVWPPPAIAADDLALMLGVRAAGWRTEMIPGARFLEIKPSGAPRAGQAERRARAYFQVLRSARSRAWGSWLDRLQLAAYGVAPAAAPWLYPLGLLLMAAAAWAWLGPLTGLFGLAALGLAHLVGPGRDLAKLLAVIERARRAEARASLSDSWEMAR
jgi:cellulose synthase/poly-beta-1,6-N-acetylglucosamine synthase-like glycosyltransferase